MAMFGPDKVKPFDELRKIVNEIFLAAHMLGTLWQRDEYEGLAEAQLEKRRQDIMRYEAIFWQMSEDDDPIVQRVDKVILEVEDICKKIIQPKQLLASDMKSLFSRVSK